MLARQLSSIGCLQMQPFPGTRLYPGKAAALHINEWCTADKMQINLSSGQQAHSRKKPCSLLEAHHFPCPRSPNACHFKKMSNKGLASVTKSHHPRERDFDLSKQLSNPIFWRQNQLQDVMGIFIPLQAYFKDVCKTSQVKLTGNIYVYFLAFETLIVALKSVIL